MKKSIISVVIVAGFAISNCALATGLKNGWRFYNMSNTYKITVIPDNMPTKAYVISSKTMSTNIIGNAQTKSFTIKSIPTYERVEIDKNTYKYKVGILNKDGTYNERITPYHGKIVSVADVLVVDVSVASSYGIKVYAWTVNHVDDLVKEGQIKSVKKVMINPIAATTKKS